MTPGLLDTIAASLLAAASQAAPGWAPGANAEQPGALGSVEMEQTNLFARVAPSVVLIMRDGVSGSGFVVGSDGLVLTNAHVVGEGDEVTVQLADGRHGKGRVVARATGALDLALVRAPFDDLTPLVAGDPSALRAGTFAATVGHGGGAAWTFSTGVIANPRPLGDGAPLVLAQLALRPGSSGGPLVDRLGRAVAVVTAGTRDASGVTFAFRIDAAAEAFPLLAQWAAAISHHTEQLAMASPGLELQGAGVEPVRTESEPRLPRVTELSRGGGAQAATPMVTVWVAPRSVRRPSVRFPPLGPLVPSHSSAWSRVP